MLGDKCLAVASTYMYAYIYSARCWPHDGHRSSNHNNYAHLCIAFQLWRTHISSLAVCVK